MFTKLKLLFKFAPLQVASLAVVVYAAVFASVLSFDKLADVPRKLNGLDLDQGYETLSQITIRPHPFISHANDDVRAYILSRLRLLVERHNHVHISDDLTSNVMFVAAEERVIYFEGNNVLFKIDGTEATDSDGVLFSCHFDSVSTAPGATDDGMGVATLLQLAEYFATPERRPRRTAIFFFNNGEEDQLNGAHAYFEHPWSNLTSLFINLEGAASGGRPIVFRSTSLGVARSLLDPAVKHPHGNILTSEAFSAGFIRSGTDYEVYARGVEGETVGLQGFDFAFYKNRAYYHTPRDSIGGMGYGQGRKALWAMMELVRGAGHSLLNDAKPGTDPSPSVYFDVFGRILIVLPMTTTYILNIVMLVIGPLSTIALIAWVMHIAQEHAPVGSYTPVSDHSKWARVKLGVKSLAGWGCFWVALIIGMLVHIGLITWYLQVNPYVVHSHSYAVLTAFLALSYLAVVLPVQALHRINPPTFVSQKLAVTLSLYSFTWILLLVSTVSISTWKLASLYWTTILHFSAWSAVVLELIHAARRGDPGNELGLRSDLFTSHEEREARAEGAISGRILVRGVLYEAPEHPHDEVAHGSSPIIDTEARPEAGGEGGIEIVETEPTEITPLIHQHRRVTQNGGEIVTVDAPDDVVFARKPADEYGWWVAQMLLLIPATAVLLFQLEILLLNALMHTLVDGSRPLSVYAILALFSLLVFIPLAPFAHKLPQSFNVVVAATLVVLLIASWTADPFTQEWPFRVYFQQSVELSPASPLIVNPSLSRRSAPLEVIRAETTLTGLKGYVDQAIVQSIPSSWTSNVSCDLEDLRPDLMTCKWTTDLLPSPNGNFSYAHGAVGGAASVSIAPRWLDVTATRLNKSRALITVRGENTRGCRLYFDRPIDFIYVHQQPQSGTVSEPSPVGRMCLQPGYGMPPGGVKEARLWSRTWSKEFVVEVGWSVGEGEGEGGTNETFGGRAACEYAEYQSGLGSADSGRIPAFEEVKAFLPLWALPTKLTDGLAEVWTRFAV